MRCNRTLVMAVCIELHAVSTSRGPSKKDRIHRCTDSRTLHRQSSTVSGVLVSRLARGFSFVWVGVYL